MVAVATEPSGWKARGGREGAGGWKLSCPNGRLREEILFQCGNGQNAGIDIIIFYNAWNAAKIIATLKKCGCT